MQQIELGSIRYAVEQRGAGPPLLLVHGFPLDHSMWSAQIEQLAPLAHVIAPDLRGFGASEVTGGTTRMEQFADDLAELLARMHVQERVAFCGLSMGGYIAWQFWQRHRALLRCLILCDTRAAADSEPAARQRLQTAERVLKSGSAVLIENMVPKLLAPGTLSGRASIVGHVERVVQLNPPEGVAAALRGMAVRDDFSAKLSAVDVPALLICGEEDAITTVDEMREMAKQMPQAQFISIADAGHLAPLEQPALVNAAIRDFLTSMTGIAG